MLIQSSELIAKPGKSGVLAQTVTAMRDVLTGASGRDFYAWAVLAGRPYGTFVLTSLSTGYTELVSGAMGVMMSAEWAELAASSDGVLAEPAPGRLLEVIAIAGEPSPSPKQFVTVISASLSGADMGAALAWSTAVAEHTAKLTGHGVQVAMTAAGPMYQVYWLTGVDTAEELEASNQAMNSDAGYLEMIAHAGAQRMFLDGSVERLLLVKMP